jgi:class 3 adenylate cyclase
MDSETAYARSGELHIAYRVVGDGPIDVTLIDHWFSNVDAFRRLPPLARFIDRLASFARVILLDKRGTGLSDPVPLGGLPTLEEWIDDIRAVLDAIQVERTALVSGVGASYLALMFAATHPQRTSALALVDGYARLTAANDYIPGLPTEFTAEEVEDIRSGWGSGILLRILAPAQADNLALLRSYAEYERQAASPGLAAAMVRMLYESDVRRILPTISVPTLVISHAESARIPAACGRYLAEHIPGARYVELAGSENLIWAGDQDSVVEEIQEFLTGVRSRAEPDRVLSTILFTDIVDSTRTAAALGDARWKDLLASHREIARAEIDRHRGREIDTTGDGFLATFDGPARAIRCAAAIRDAVRELGVVIRAGLHTGEIELMGAEDIGGIAVHIGARICALAGAGEILVSSTVRDLVVGSGIEFVDRGEHQLKGVPGEWRLFAMVR